MSGAERYRKEQRLHGKVITQILAAARPRRSASVLVHSRPNGLNYSRLGLIVPKRLLPRAVDRNRARRVLREWFRRNQVHFSGQDLVVRLAQRPAEIDSLIPELVRLSAS